MVGTYRVAAASREGGPVEIATTTTANTDTDTIAGSRKSIYPGATRRRGRGIAASCACLKAGQARSTHWPGARSTALWRRSGTTARYSYGT